MVPGTDEPAGQSSTRPNNRLQTMPGLACFGAEDSLARGPRTPDPCVVVRPLSASRSGEQQPMFCDLLTASWRK